MTIKTSTFRRTKIGKGKKKSLRNCLAQFCRKKTEMLMTRQKMKTMRMLWRSCLKARNKMRTTSIYFRTMRSMKSARENLKGKNNSRSKKKSKGNSKHNDKFNRKPEEMGVSLAATKISERKEVKDNTNNKISSTTKEMKENLNSNNSMCKSMYQREQNLLLMRIEKSHKRREKDTKVVAEEELVTISNVMVVDTTTVAGKEVDTEAVEVEEAKVGVTETITKEKKKKEIAITPRVIH